MARNQESAAFVALVQAVAGATGGVCAAFVLMPVEVAKTRIQVSQTGDSSMTGVLREILATEGIGGLFRGVAAKCTETGSKNFVYFYIYDAFNTLAKMRGIQLTTVVKLLLGYSAGVVNTTLTMPLEVLSTRLQVEDKGIVGLADAILRTEGLSGLFKGFWFNVLLCINPAIQNTSFDKMKAAILKTMQNPTLSPLQAFTLGAVAKAIATVITFPLVRLKTMLQAGKPPERSPSKIDSGVVDDAPERKRTKSTGQMLRSMSFRHDREEREHAMLHRISQLYRGLGSQLTKSVLQAAFLYMAKDQVESFVVRFFKVSAKLLFRRSGRVKLGAFSGRPLAS